MRTRYLIICVVCLAIAACGGGGGSNSGNIGDSGGDNGGGDNGGGTNPPPVTNATSTVLAFNDLGMHCMDREFSVFSILPPFNVVHSQVVLRDADGKPYLAEDIDVDVSYDAVTDPSGSRNSYSAGVAKTDFWLYVNNLFGVNLTAGQGLTGLYMPADDPLNRGAQPMDYSTSAGWFSAEGIPITPVDDNLDPNTYSLLQIAAHDKTSGSKIGSLDVVVPVATETDCQACHANGKIATQRAGIAWADDADLEVQSKKNILILHDALQSTDLSSSTPVLCAQCHYSPALDLAQTGPSPEQQGNPVFSNVMHGYHGKLKDLSGGPLFPPNAPVSATCYQCHPGNVTQCQRGAMKTGGIECNSCHGDMLAVGGEYDLLSGGSIDGTNDGNPRRPWQDLPRCQSCHTGDAVDHLTGSGLVFDASGIRLKQTFKTGDASASPLLAQNLRFAENTNTLFRFSKGHGGVNCESCHGSTHAIWPNKDTAANDNIAATQLQGHDGTIIECGTCHGQGSLPLTTNGPHGLHNVADARWVDENHGDFYERNKAGCQACHGLELLGTPLAKTAAARSFRAEDRTVTFAKGDLVSCNRCHERPSL
jgi:hypothetical protein